MDNKKNLPILMNGEKLAEPIIKNSGGGEKRYPRNYESAKQILLNDIKELKNVFSENLIQNYMLDEFVICIRMADGFIAKSFEPNIFERDKSMDLVGARNYKVKQIEDTDKDYTISKLYFLRTTIDAIDRFEQNLINDEFTNYVTLKKQLCSINKLDLLSREEIMLGFEDDWTDGRVEIVLHPLKNRKKDAISIINRLICMKSDKDLKIREYDDGPTFISAKLDRETLYEISKYNFLRTVHPMRGIKIPQIRTGDMVMPAPKSLITDVKSNIKVGVFDGGAKENVPLLNNFVKINNDTISSSIDVDGISHGTAVCGSVLYGALNRYSGTSTVNMPAVSVESFRVLPTSDPSDIDLYEVVDIIEDIVPKRNDIGIYNISLGPRGPILDDQVSRFTYALDRLAYKYEVLFCVAVGNDGHLSSPLNRIQSPSDLVNGLGIGAYTYTDDNQKIHAYYSCVGEGREGCKIKPDIVAFGGCANRPFHAVSVDGNYKSITCGTSFSSPVTAGMAGRIIAYSSDITPQIARTLLIHTAKNPYQDRDNRLGHGYILDSEEEILNCNGKEFTVLYNGAINPTQYLKLPIPLPKLYNNKGKVFFKWTISILADPNILDSDGYTSYCVEDTFHPNSEVYIMRHKYLSPKTKRVNINEDLEIINELRKKGYELSGFPISDSPKGYVTEEERRLDLKWDTIVRKSKSKMISSIKNPFIVLHGMSRSTKFNKKIKFSVAVTVSIPAYEGNLYYDILNEYKVLQPIKLRNQSEIMIKI